MLATIPALIRNRFEKLKNSGRRVYESEGAQLRVSWATDVLGRQGLTSSKVEIQRHRWAQLYQLVDGFELREDPPCAELVVRSRRPPRRSYRAATVRTVEK